MSKNIKELYAKYVEDKLSSEEIASFMQEVGATSDDELWALMQQHHAFGAEEAMEETVKDRQRAFFEEQIQPGEGWRLWRYAAAIVVLFVSVTLAYWYFSVHLQQYAMTEVAAAAGNQVTLRLPDGSRVRLNSGSLLQYAVVAGKHREVNLVRGESFFDVAKDPQCPFKVMVQGMEIEVLGTTFNVRSLSNRVETALFTGKVKLNVGDGDAAYQLSPGEKAIYQPTNRQMRFAKADALLDAGWKEGYLSFKSAPLIEVLRQIEQRYGVKIRLMDDKLKGDLLTGSFRHETLESVLTSLSIQYGFSYEAGQDEIRIKNL